MPLVGILALQGAYQKHAEALDRLGVPWVLVRQPEDLAGIERLIIPGGESTTITRLLRAEGWWDQLREYARTHPVMGTCAGLIMLAKDLRDPDGRVQPLGLLDVTVSRNAFGRQIDSFMADLEAPELPGLARYPGVFIRAPRIEQVGPDVEILATCQGEPVAVRAGHWLGLTFHPELTDDDRFHEIFMATA